MRQSSCGDPAHGLGEAAVLLLSPGTSRCTRGGKYCLSGVQQISSATGLLLGQGSGASNQLH